MTPWILVPLLPFVIAGAVLCLRQPMRVALPAFAAVLPFGKGLSFADSPFGSVSSLVGLLLAAGLVLQLMAGRRSARSLSWSVPIWILFLALAVVSALWSVHLGTTLTGLAVIGSLIVTYVLVVVSEVDRTVVVRTENALLVGGLAAVGYGLFQLLVLGGFPADTTRDGVDESGRFGNDLLGPGVQAVALLLPLALALHRAFAAESRRYRLGYAAASGLLFFGILMTGSRTGTLASALVILALALSGRRQSRRGMLGILVVAVAIAATVWIFQPAGVATRTFESATSSSGRLDIWRVAAVACEEYCLGGSGWGTFPEVYAQTQASVPGARVLVGEGSYQPHNVWVLAIIELGVSGVVLMSVGLLIALRESWALPRDRRGPILGALLGLVFGLFFLSSIEFKFFWMFLMMVGLHRNLTLAESRQAREDVGQVDTRSTG